MKENICSHDSSGNFFDSIIDDGTEPTVQPEVNEVRSRTLCNRLHSIIQGPDPNGSQIALIRCAGSLCLIFGLAEIGLGSSIFAKFVNAGVGAWWSTLLVVIAGIYTPKVDVSDIVILNDVALHTYPRKSFKKLFFCYC